MNDGRIAFDALLARYRAGQLSRRRLFQRAAALGMGAAALSAVTRPGGVGAQPSGELTLVLPRSLVALDPHGAQSVEEATAVVSNHILGTLTARDPVTGELLPRLAVSWEPTDETTWTFTLREGVKFHDGTDVTSADVKASLERVIALEGPLAPLWAPVTSVEAPDPLTVQIKTSQPLGTVPISSSLLYVAPAAHLEDEAFFTAPFGMGAFKFVDWTPDSQLTMEANPDFWDGAPGLERLVIRDIPETAARVTAIETGEVDFTYALPADQLPALQENEELQIDSVSSYAYYFVWFNNSREPFTNPQVRRAMIHALDIDTMVNDLLQGVAVRAQAPIPSTVFGFAPQTPYAYDPELARSLLAEAGFPDGFQTSIIWNPGSGPQDRELMLTMISYWAEIGVQVENLEQERALWLENLLALEWDMDFQTNTVRSGDADFTLRRLYVSSANRLGYANPDLDVILNDAAAASDQAQRAELYAEACRIIWEDAAGIFPFELVENYVYRDRVQGFVAPPSAIPIFEKVTVSE
jgi:peptide/nickel transport system substrate-binding protein